MDWNRHQEAVSQLFSWMAGGMIGGVTLSLVGSSLDVFSIIFWLLFATIALVGYAFSFMHTQVKPEKNSIESDVEEIKSELSELREDISKSKSETSEEDTKTENKVMGEEAEI